MGAEAEDVEFVEEAGPETACEGKADPFAGGKGDREGGVGEAELAKKEGRQGGLHHHESAAT